MLPDIVSSYLHKHNFTRLFLCTDGTSVKQSIDGAKIKKVILHKNFVPDVLRRFLKINNQAFFVFMGTNKNRPFLYFFLIKFILILVKKVLKKR